MTNQVVTHGFDIYHGNSEGTNGPVQFGAAAKASPNPKFAIIKATQGLHGKDPLYADHRKRAHTAGYAVVGAYHFMDPFSDPIAQAEHFVNVANPQKGELVLSLDLEELPGTGKTPSPTDAYACAKEIKALTGYWPIIYCSDSMYQTLYKERFPANLHTLWIARYGHPPVSPYAFWQYSEKGNLLGQGPFDMDVYNGSLEDLIAKHTIK